jgi:hypothetical protein
LQRAPQVAGCSRIILLLERDSRKLEREAFVPRLETGAGFEGVVGLLPAGQPRKSGPVVLVKFSGRRGYGADQADDLLPIFLLKEAANLDQCRIFASTGLAEHANCTGDE